MHTVFLFIVVFVVHMAPHWNLTPISTTRWLRDRASLTFTVQLLKAGFVVHMAPALAGHSRRAGRVLAAWAFGSATLAGPNSCTGRWCVGVLVCWCVGMLVSLTCPSAPAWLSAPKMAATLQRPRYPYTLPTIPTDSQSEGGGRSTGTHCSDSLHPPLPPRATD